MIRTQIYIDQQLHKELSFLAKQKKESMAQIVRVMLEEGVQRKKIDRSGKSNLLALANFNAIGEDIHLSSNIDHYMYGAPKKHE